MNYELAPAIESDLESIGLYIARHNQRRALSFVHELQSHFETIADNPEGYRLREEFGPGIRISAYGRYIVVFRILGGIVRIDRVLSGYRNFIGLA